MESPLVHDNNSGEFDEMASKVNPVMGAVAFISELVSAVAKQDGIVLTVEQTTAAIAWCLNEFARTFADTREVRIPVGTAIANATTYAEAETPYFVH